MSFYFLNRILSIDVFDNKTGTHQLLKYGSVALLSHFAKCKNRKCENKKCEKTSMAQNA